jgi:arginase
VATRAVTGNRSAASSGARRPAAPSVVALAARISEDTPRDLRGVRTLARLAAERFGAAPQTIEGRQGPFGRTGWREDLEASRAVLGETGARLAAALATPDGLPLTLATDCALGLATLPTVARLVPEARVLWLDAHCDYDTPATTTIGFLGCMSLAGACGEWDAGFGPHLPPRRVVLCGTRPAPDDFDVAAQRAVEASDVTLVGIADTTTEEVLAALGGAPVYVHLDPDVLDPTVNPVPYARPGGLSAAGLRALLAAVAARHAVVGVEITAFHSPDDPTERDELGRFLLEVVAPLLSRRNGG